jgi:hypothetical protein
MMVQDDVMLVGTVVVVVVVMMMMMMMMTTTLTGSQVGFTFPGSRSLGLSKSPSSPSPLSTIRKGKSQ